MADNRITILHDSFGHPSALRQDWGFAALIEFAGQRLLFDTGNNARTFAHNCGQLGIDLDAFTSQHAQALVQLALKHGLAGIYWSRAFVQAGGLMTYSASVPDLLRRGAIYVDKILKGASPADLFVEQPTRFEFVINRRTADALGLRIPLSLLVRADEVIQ